MVDRHTFIVGKTGSGKSYRMYRLFERHEGGPAIVCDFEWTKGVADFDVETTDVSEVVEAIRQGPDSHDGRWPHVRWLLDNYDSDFDDLVAYLKDVHRTAHLADHPLPRVGLFMDEIHRVAPTWADARNSAVRVFTEGRHHSIFGVGVTQWPAQTSRLVGMNAYDWYVYFLNPKELTTLSQYYHMDVPDVSYLSIVDHSYFRYSSDGGVWWRGSSTGVETAEVSEMPGTADDGRPLAGEEREPAVVPVPVVRETVPAGSEDGSD